MHSAHKNMNTIDEIKQRIDIVNLAGRYAQLKKAGANYKANCPFHSEKTPSFVVYPDRGSWHCFGACSTGGSVFDLMMRAENIEFPEALKRLAEQAGIKYDKDRRPEPGSTARLQALERINAIAAEWFQAGLASAAGEQARQYLAGRGIDADAARRFGIGFAPGGTLQLRDKLKAQGVGEERALEARLLTRGADGAVRDFFRERITFQIRNHKGVVVGFGARAMRDDDQPKYINTPETPAFSKSSILYGLDRAIKAIGTLRQAIVMEGYMDVIAAQQHGHENAVATMGVALTDQHLDILARHLRGGQLILCLDADAAGQEATLRALQMAWDFTSRSGIEVKVVQPGSGKDPDELIRNAPAEWRQLLSTAVPAINFIMAAHAERNDPSTPEGKQRIIESVVPLIFSIANDFARDARLTELANLLQVDVQRLQSIGRPRAEEQRSGRQRDGAPPAPRERVGINPAALRKSAARNVEDYLLAILLNYRDARSVADALEDECWSDVVNRQVFSLWRSGKLDGDEVPGPLVERIDELNKLSEEPLRDGQERIFKMANECASRLRERHLKRVMQDAADNDAQLAGAGSGLQEIYVQRSEIGWK